MIAVEYEVGQIADQVAERIRPMLAVSELPEHISAAVAEAAKHGRWVSNFWHSFGSLQLRMDIAINPDGTIMLELADMCGTTVWRHVLRPAKEHK
jgi:hypothetical protein